MNKPAVSITVPEFDRAPWGGLWSYREMMVSNGLGLRDKICTKAHHAMISTQTSRYFRDEFIDDQE